MNYYFEISDVSDDCSSSVKRGFVCSDFVGFINGLRSLTFNFRPDAKVNLRKDAVDSINSILKGEIEGKEIYNLDDGMFSFGKVAVYYYDYRGFFVRVFKVYTALSDTIEGHNAAIAQYKENRRCRRITRAMDKGDEFYNNVQIIKSELCSSLHSDYSVTIKMILVCIRGGVCKNETYSAIVAADSKIDAYNKVASMAANDLHERYGEQIEYYEIPESWFKCVEIMEWR